MTALELDQILTLDWPPLVRKVMAGDADGWTKSFVLSIARHGKRPNWHPSPKQASLMRRLVADHKSAAGGEIEVIDE